MKKKILKVFIVIILTIIIAILILSLLNNKVMPIYINYAEGEIKSLVTTVITKSVNDDLLEKYTNDELFIISEDSNTKMTKWKR